MASPLLLLSLCTKQKLMKRTDYNFKDCLYDPTSDKFLTSITNIKEFKEYKGTINKQKLFTWIVIMFDLNSPLRKTITNFYERKKMAADVAGFRSRSNGEFDEEATKMLLGQDEAVNALVVAYLVQFSMPEYTLLIAYLNMQYALTRDAMTNMFDQNTAKTLDFVTSKISTLTNIVYGSGQTDEVMLARKALYHMAEQERIKLNPENVVKIMIDDGALPKSFNPYDSSYTPENIKFYGDEA